MPKGIPNKKPEAPESVNKAEFDQIKDTVENVVEQQGEILNLVAAMSETLSTLAKNNPVSITSGIESQDFQTGADETVNFRQAGDEHDAELVVERPRIVDPENPAFSEKVANEAFMHEMVTVIVNPDNDPRADPVVEIGVNGHTELFPRGVKRTVKRMFVEGLARAKPVKFRNVSRVNPETGVEEVVNPTTTGQRYPFTVVEDRNRLGASWLQSVLAQRA
jgi:hypothetical protein